VLASDEDGALAFDEGVRHPASRFWLLNVIRVPQDADRREG
jgi:hypothetical protein